jgi:hypothetical protein
MKQKCRETNNQPTIVKPSEDHEQVVGDVVHVTKPVDKKLNELQVLDYETGNLVPAQENECENVEQPIDTDKQLTIGKPPVDDEQVVGNVLHVSEPENKKQNELQVLHHESGNLELGTRR